jgi:hypothetical protein
MADPNQRTFYGCWAVDQTGPIEGGGCEGLDAWSCSQHDDCVAIHDNTCDGPVPGGGADSAGAPACGLGNFLLCAPEAPNNQIGCYTDTDCPADTRCNANEICLPPPGSGAGDGQGVPVPACYGYCVPTTVDGGNCWEAVACDEAPPVCPPNSVPGVRDGCYTGVCIELSLCEPYPCSWLDENACVARADCTPYYQGVNCTCDADGNCVCEDWVFTACQ